MLYRVEIRVDIEADSPESAEALAWKAVADGDGEVTAVFDEDWNEV
jgi:hypothetical protein